MNLENALSIVINLAAAEHDDKRESVSSHAHAMEADALMHVRALWLKERAKNADPKDAYKRPDNRGGNARGCASGSAETA